MVQGGARCRVQDCAGWCRVVQGGAGRDARCRAAQGGLRLRWSACLRVLVQCVVQLGVLSPVEALELPEQCRRELRVLLTLPAYLDLELRRLRLGLGLGLGLEPAYLDLELRCLRAVWCARVIHCVMQHVHVLQHGMSRSHGAARLCVELRDLLLLTRLALQLGRLQLHLRDGGEMVGRWWGDGGGLWPCSLVHYSCTSLSCSYYA